MSWITAPRSSRQIASVNIGQNTSESLHHCWNSASLPSHLVDQSPDFLLYLGRGPCEALVDLIHPTRIFFNSHAVLLPFEHVATAATTISLH